MCISARVLEVNSEGAVIHNSSILTFMLYHVRAEQKGFSALLKIRMGVQLAWQAEWRLPVGCDYSGFFVEVLVQPALEAIAL